MSPIHLKNRIVFHAKFAHMDSEWRKKIQITLGIFLVVAIVRVAMIYHARNDPGEVKKPPQPVSSYTVTTDDYVALPKIFPYDTKSAARDLAGKTVWVRTGNQLSYYRYVAATRRVEFNHKAGLLAPLEKLEIRDAVQQRAPRSGERQVLAVFNKVGEQTLYAAVIGAENDVTYTFLVNDMFFLDDPHKLYSYWPSEVWSAIDHHEAKPGMNELQVSLALGTSASASPGEIGERTMEYANGGNPVKVTFTKNKAVSVAAEKEQ